ncbi:carbohydrate ABC transporter permease [Microbacterium sp. BR1]|uniref:carbohydrate ABC transporter permease n=1 Tax=Microbacterium sp. BR1 TaxID=1070896 RepID=UPI0012FD25F8|nr:carbohydrate ABC transporter permease [Microbacterium sp. BR1]
MSSFRTDADVKSSGWWTMFTNPSFTRMNYVGAFEVFDLAPSLANSVLIALPVAIITVVVAATTAYVFTFVEFRGRDTLFVLVIALVAVPPQVMLVPLLQVLNALGLGGEVAPLWLIEAGFGLPFGVLLLRAGFSGIPMSLMDAAAVDGASRLTTFLRIILPLSLPSLIALAVFQFLWSWNDLLFPLVFLGPQNDGAPITVNIAGLVQSNGQGENLVAAATTVSIILPLVIFFALQRYFVRGITAGAVKD